MKLETLRLANRMNDICVFLEENIQNFKISRRHIEFPENCSFLSEVYLQEQQKATIAIVNTMSQILKDMKENLYKLTDESYSEVNEYVESIVGCGIKLQIKEELECPHGHRFGIDIDKYDEECEECSVFDACSKKTTKCSVKMI